mgnify:CR=1 FL=1
MDEYILHEIKQERRKGESPWQMGSECTRTISYHYDIMVLFTCSSKSLKEFKLLKEASEDTELAK